MGTTAVKISVDVEESKKCNWLKKEMIFWNRGFIVYLLNCLSQQTSVCGELVRKTEIRGRCFNCCQLLSFCNALFGFISVVEGLHLGWKWRKVEFEVMEGAKNFLGSSCSLVIRKTDRKPARDPIKKVRRGEMGIQQITGTKVWTLMWDVSSCVAWSAESSDRPSPESRREAAAVS